MAGGGGTLKTVDVSTLIFLGVEIYVESGHEHFSCDD